MIKLKGKNSLSVDTDLVVKTVEILNALLVDQTGAYVSIGANEYIEKIEIMKR